MRTRIALKLAAFLVLLLGTTVNGLFFHYPKNVLSDFFKSLHQKKEMKPPQNIHHYHLHYYPVHAQYLTKPIKAPIKFDLDKLHSNHLESLGWGENEYKYVPEPEIYRTSPLDSWPESSLARSLLWDDDPPNRGRQIGEKSEVSNGAILVQVPLHQNIVVQQPPKEEEKPAPNPLVSFFQSIRRIKNSLFSSSDDRKDEKKDNSDEASSITNKLKTYVVYANPESSSVRKM